MWTARYGDEIAQGDRTSVTCTETEVEANANATLLQHGGFKLTPTGPHEPLPSELATWAAFLSALAAAHPEVTEFDVDGGPVMPKVPFDRDVIY